MHKEKLLAVLKNPDMNAFERAALTANKDCPQCLGTGQYQYSTHGTPHFTICKDCCLHDEGTWTLTEHQRALHSHPGHECCKAGCGKTWETKEDYLRDIPQVDS
jgi:ssDNA-binding Zn-finger/Zn-ribbon topoisomerase 1